MNHLINHPHALIKNNIVIEIFDFSEHNSELLNDVKSNFDVDEIVCCCDNGIAFKGGTWIDGQFRPIPIYDYFIWNGTEWVPPILKPEGDNWYWNDYTREWTMIESSAE